MFATQCSKPHKINTGTPMNTPAYLPMGFSVLRKQATATYMIIPQKIANTKMLKGLSLNFAWLRVSAFADNVEATLVTRNKYPTPTVAAKLPIQIISKSIRKAGCFSLKSPTLPVNNANCWFTTVNNPMENKNAPTTLFSTDKLTVPPIAIIRPASSE